MRIFVALVCIAGCGGGPLKDLCTVDGECPVHQLCAGGACETGCVSDEECGPGQRCSEHGHCAGQFDADASNVVDLSAPATADLAAFPDLSSSSDLMPSTVCGDGRTDGDEECDDGPANSDDATTAASCTSRCRRRAPCGSLVGAGGAHIDPESGHCFVVWPSPSPWASAQSDCQSRGGALVSVNSANEEAIVRALAGSQVVWIGLTSPVGEWLDGGPVGYQDFAPGEPNGDGDCVWLDPAAGWKDAACSWPSSGMLPASPTSKAGYVCENGCGNGRVEQGEECDPPGTDCTSTCQRVRSCPEGMSSPTTGHCYFAVAATVDYSGALAGCPAGTHLATLETLDETALAKKVISADSWIALHAAVTADTFTWDGSMEPFAPRRYHGFASGEPNTNAVPDCARMTTDGWKDITCTNKYASLCERE